MNGMVHVVAWFHHDVISFPLHSYIFPNSNLNFAIRKQKCHGRIGRCWFLGTGDWNAATYGSNLCRVWTRCRIHGLTTCIQLGHRRLSLPNSACCAVKWCQGLGAKAWCHSAKFCPRRQDLNEIFRTWTILSHTFFFLHLIQLDSHCQDLFVEISATKHDAH